MSFNEIRKIDNAGVRMPKLTFLIVGGLIFLAIWFMRGGSFILYASMFFGLYDITKIVWLSIILVSLVQNIAFLPLRLLGEKMRPDFKDFEDTLDEIKREDEQYLLVQKKIQEGDTAVLVYLLNFVLVAIAFVSAGRIFLLDFYQHQISQHYLYNFIPYPDYPLRGTIFHFPFIKITQTTAVSWSTIFLIWGIIIGVMVAARLLWVVVVKYFLRKSKRFLNWRIAYNRLILFFSGFIVTLLILSTIFLRHIPTVIEPLTLAADLSKQNTTFNIITAIASFFAALYAGVSHSREGAREARAKGISEKVIRQVLKAKDKITIRNGILLALFAYFATHLLPCSHDLSVLAFEAIYILSPYTIDAFIMKKVVKKKQPEAATALSD